MILDFLGRSLTATLVDLDFNFNFNFYVNLNFNPLIFFGEGRGVVLDDVVNSPRSSKQFRMELEGSFDLPKQMWMLLTSLFRYRDMSRGTMVYYAHNFGKHHVLENT